MFRQVPSTTGNFYLQQKDHKEAAEVRANGDEVHVDPETVEVVT